MPERREEVRPAVRRLGRAARLQFLPLAVAHLLHGDLAQWRCLRGRECWRRRCLVELAEALASRHRRTRGLATRLLFGAHRISLCRSACRRRLRIHLLLFAFSPASFADPVQASDSVLWSYQKQNRDEEAESVYNSRNDGEHQHASHFNE